MGQWQDPATSRTILKWLSEQRGSVHFGVESMVSGSRGATFAEISQEVSLQGTYFDLMNCLQVLRYRIVEEVVKINKASSRVDVYFYKYKVIAPNEKIIAETSLFRADDYQVNVTMYKDDISLGPTIARAQRIGAWTRDDWRQCSSSLRAWLVEFPMSQRDVDLAATVMDLRVVSAAMITLIAFRAETQSASGAPPRDSIAQLFTSILNVFLAISAFALITYMLYHVGWAGKLRRSCFKIEAACLPRRVALKRVPPLNPT
jgi:hypothetical protein